MIESLQVCRNELSPARLPAMATYCMRAYNYRRAAHDGASFVSKWRVSSAASVATAGGVSTTITCHGSKVQSSPLPSWWSTRFHFYKVKNISQIRIVFVKCTLQLLP